MCLAASYEALLIRAKLKTSFQARKVVRISLFSGLRAETSLDTVLMRVRTFLHRRNPTACSGCLVLHLMRT